MKKIIFFIPFLLFALTNTQINILKTTYKIASQFKAIDGHIFNDTMCAIILTETSAGKVLIGDNYYQNGKEKRFIEKSLGVGQIKLETAIRMILKYPGYFPKLKNYIHKDPFVYKKYVIYLNKIAYFEDIVERYKNKHSYRARRVLKWAKRELNYYNNKMKKYNNYYKKDLILAQLLLTDIPFNIKVGTLYLITNYNYALKKHFWNPWFKTISRYNGGWFNRKYYKKVIKNIKIWRRIKYAYINKR